MIANLIEQLPIWWKSLYLNLSSDPASLLIHSGPNSHQPCLSISNIYDSFLNNIKNIRIIKPCVSSRFNYFKYVVILERVDRQSIHEALQERGINVSGYIYELPLHKQPVFNSYNEVSLPMTEYLCAQHICLPIYPTLGKDDAEYIAKNLIEILNCN